MQAIKKNNVLWNCHVRKKKFPKSQQVQKGRSWAIKRGTVKNDLCRGCTPVDLTIVIYLNYVPSVLGVNVAALVSRKQNVVGLPDTQIISININSLFHLSLVPFGVPPLRSLSLQSRSPCIRSLCPPQSSPIPVSFYPQSPPCTAFPSPFPVCLSPQSLLLVALPTPTRAQLQSY